MSMRIRGRLPAAVFATLALGACRNASSAASAEAEVASSRSAVTTSQASDLPPGCVLFLAQVQCWLRKSGNVPAEADRAVGAARALLESRPPVGPPDDTAMRCQRAQARRKEDFEAAGCEEVVAELATLPPADPIACPSNEHFFIRRDGRVSGCHPDCVTSADCPSGSSCTGVGSAPGGPIEEPYCE